MIGCGHADAVDPAYYPEPLIRTYTGPDGREIHAHVYPPHSPDRIAPADELPPYVIWAHGGPTSHVPLVLDLETAYFTSRGIGVVEVDYGGSTDTAAPTATGCANSGASSTSRTAPPSPARSPTRAPPTRPGSRSGAAARAAGPRPHPSPPPTCTPAAPSATPSWTSWAGRGGTHDFESRYLETLVGPFAEVPGRYRERSPAQHADRIAVPFLLLQGLDDVICPPAQCERFLDKMAGRGIPHAYLTFEGEGHGFRRAATMVRALEAELSLYAPGVRIDRDDIPCWSSPVSARRA